ncbi:MAG: four helix bundle protein [Patescibacteria group bacterium]
MPIQNPNPKSQNDREQFKKDFIRRLIQFTVHIIKLGERIKGENRLLWSIVDQVIRSGGSIGANVVEAKGSGSKRDYIHFFEIALKSANETIYWLMVLQETVSVSHRDEVEAFSREANEFARIIGASIVTMKGRR